MLLPFEHLTRGQFCGLANAHAQSGEAEAGALEFSRGVPVPNVPDVSWPTESRLWALRWIVP